MKQFILITCMAVAMTSCNDSKTTTTGTDTTGNTVKAADVELPFKLDRPYRNWQMGSTENTVAAMSSLKAFVDKDYTKMAASLGDSVDLRFDYFHASLSHDSAVKVLTAHRERYTDIIITMYDYESVISADKKDEYVTIWYKQVSKNDKGVSDSLSVIDDLKMKNGKLVEIDEKIQHFPAKK